MPVHALLGLAAALAAPVAAVLALAYALLPATRAGLRWPALGTSVVAAAVCGWAAAEASPVWDRLKAAGPVTAIARSHKDNSGGMLLAAVVLALVLWVVVWRPLAPGRPRSLASTVAATLVVLAALATLVLTWTTVADAVASVWTHHSLWKA